MIRRLSLCILSGLALLFAAAPVQAQQAASASRFDGWTSAVIAGDWTGQGRPIMAFDNAVRDLSAAFVGAGFAPETMVSRTLRPDVPTPTTPREAVDEIARTAAQATRGCFLYFTSHGSPNGIVFGPNTLLPPQLMARLVNQWCGDRPTVIVVSACFSGVFIPHLQGPNRIVMTAARPDRSSFGCGEGSTYPYFDGCVLESLPDSADFLVLAERTRQCVERRETEEGLQPPSQPQLSIGANMQVMAPTLRFSRPAP